MAAVPYNRNVLILVDVAPEAPTWYLVPSEPVRPKIEPLDMPNVGVVERLLIVIFPDAAPVGEKVVVILLSVDDPTLVAGTDDLESTAVS